MAGVIDLTGNSDDEEEDVSPNKALQQFLLGKPQKETAEARNKAKGINQVRGENLKQRLNDDAKLSSTAIASLLAEGSGREQRLHVKGLSIEAKKAGIQPGVQRLRADHATKVVEPQELRGVHLKPQLLENGQSGGHDAGKTRSSTRTNVDGRDPTTDVRPFKKRRVDVADTSPHSPGANIAASSSNDVEADATWNSARWANATGPVGSDQSSIAPSRKFPTVEDANVLAPRPATLREVLREVSTPLASAHKPPEQPVPLRVSPKGQPRQFTADENALLIQLKEVEKLTWSEIAPQFPNRSSATLQVHYSSKLKHRNNVPERHLHHVAPPKSTVPVSTTEQPRPTLSRNTVQAQSVPLPRKNRGAGRPVTDGFISWQDARAKQEARGPNPITTNQAVTEQQENHPHQSHGFPSTVGRILRRREIGLSTARASQCATRSPGDELRNHIFDSVGPRKYFKGTSADVNCLAWAPNGRHFAAGSIAITDERSMQYNRPYNLVYGDTESNVLYELPEHHILRPAIDPTSGNVNALPSMRQTQDTRLFTTVGNVSFTTKGDRLFSVGEDKKTRVYGSDNRSRRFKCLQTFNHTARVDLVSINEGDLVATAQHSSQDSIVLYQQEKSSEEYSKIGVYGPKQSSQSSLPIFPTTLKFGLAPQHQHYLLTGFASDSYDDDLTKSGESQLRNLTTGQLIDVSTTHNVFDVAWNPVPSAASTIFAVASAPTLKTRGIRSVVQCFAPIQGRAKRVLEWDCPALDINDVLYCQHDSNLIAAGATDGKVYVWDQRYASASQGPLHVFAHGNTLNLLDHDREIEEADTGIRFLAWGATSSRLYSGSSDGMVKVWNPHLATENAFVKDVATFGSAVMSGAFSPDYRDLLVGEDQGQINLLSIDCEGRSIRFADRFTLQPAPTPEVPKMETGVTLGWELLDSKQIALCPMGNLPVRQAVQGPKYSGPYFKPTQAEINKAEEHYQRALGAQNDAHSKAAVTGSQDASTMNALRDADNRVRDTQLAIERLESRRREADTLEQQAAETQAHFRQLRKNQRDASPCRLDCNHLPVNNDGEVSDNGYSFLRIPSNLRNLKSAFDEASSADSREEPCAATCTSCSARVGKLTGSQPTLCGKCWLQRNGLTAVCTQCSLPAKPADAGPTLCARCNFPCFRCSQPARVSPASSCITCTACGLAWNADVLGYTLLRSPSLINMPKTERVDSKPTQEKHDDDEDDFGTASIEYYHSQWQERGTEGWSTDLKQAYEQH